MQKKRKEPPKNEIGSSHKSGPSVLFDHHPPPKTPPWVGNLDQPTPGPPKSVDKEKKRRPGLGEKNKKSEERGEWAPKGV